MNDLFTNIHSTTAESGQLESLITSCEESLNVHISIHDHLGFFKTHDGLPLLKERHIHWHPHCQLHRQQSFALCYQHCVNEIDKHIDKQIQSGRSKPFISHCWKGIEEIIIPLLHNKIHIATLYAGAWQQKKPLNTFPEQVRHQQHIRSSLQKLRRALNEKEYAMLTDSLQCWAQGFIQEAEIIQGINTNPTNRYEQILYFFHRRSHELLRLADLAKELNCSESRAGQLCRELCGKNFQLLLLEERLKRAKALLHSSPHSIGQIAESCGFGDIYYFSRAFKKYFQQTPTSVRKNKIKNTK